MTHLVTKVAEYAIITNSKDEFLMINFPNTQLWHFPGGRIDEGEQSLEGLVREVHEEVGIEIIDPQPIYTKYFHPEDPKYAVFFVTQAKEPYEVKVGTGHDACSWFSKEDISTLEFWQPFYKEILEKTYDQGR